MAADTLFFRRTGSETRPFVQVRLVAKSGRMHGVAAMSGPMLDGIQEDDIEITGELADVLREAQQYAALNGLDLRIALDGHEWPNHLGVIGNRS